MAVDEGGVISHIFALPPQTAEEEQEGESRGWGYEELREWVEKEGIFKGKGEREWVWVRGGEGRKGKGKGRGTGEGWWFPGFVGKWVLSGF